MAGGKRIHKTVHHYLFRETGGKLAAQESEVDEVGWFPLSEIVERLAYPDEKKANCPYRCICGVGRAMRKFGFISLTLFLIFGFLPQATASNSVITLVR
jgi:hypothetical protein